MSTTLAERTYSTAEVAELLGLRPWTIYRWARDWHPRAEQRLTPVDLKVCRAFAAITAGERGGWVTQAHIQRAEAAIRADPLRYLAMTPEAAETFDSGEDAIAWWSGPGMWLCDLQPDEAA
jgi:hypothetical protein